MNKISNNDLNDFYRGGARNYQAPAEQLWTLPFLTFIALNLFIFMGFDVLLPTLSLYLEGQGNTETDIGRIFAIFTVSAVLMRMLAGRLASYFNPMRLARLGLLFCAIAGAFYYWADTVPTAMAARFLHGAGFGLASTLITALASQIIPPLRLGEGMGYLGLGTTLALALGPFFGVWLMDEFGFFVLFMVVAGFYVLSVIGISALPKIKMAGPPPGAPRPRLVLVSPSVIAPSVMMFMVGLSMSSAMIYLALYCKEINLPYAGHFFVLSTAGIFISRLTAGRIHDRIGHSYVIIPASILLAATMFLLAKADTRGMIFTASILYGLSTGAIFPSVQALAMSAVDISRRTEATASIFNSFDLGVGLGSVILGYVAGRMGSYNSVYWAATAVAVVFLLYYLCVYIFFPSKTKDMKK
ncbi:hypothetical protein C4J81_04305 [Deltaproteobacteria bacterium Smac51]|nr:hypothetical protein C4J81_04305 [Deltaproteobacteria bacterium Smac51]